MPPAGESPAVLFGQARRASVSGWYTPVKGKCTWWRESLHDDDVHDTTVKKPDKRVQCMCMVEGRSWTFTHVEVPSECPDSRHCRYYIKNW